jgi:ABC-2 type transport system ATP-binding protein
MPQDAILYPDLTLAQNLRFAASLYGLGRRVRGRLGELTDFLDLDEAMVRLPTQASGGEQRRLMLAATLAHSPELMFLDEPTAGIDPVLRRRIWEHLHEISETTSQ